MVDSCGLNHTDSIQVTVEPASMCPAGSIDFSTLALTSYSNQNNSNDVAVEDDGDTLHLSNNTWLRSTDVFTITENTVIDFDFSSIAQGEIHAIGFDNDDTLNNDPRHFQFWGTQNWNGTGQIDWSPEYSGSGEVESYSIPVGQYYTGSMRLVLTNDQDSGSGAESRFSCVRVHDVEPPPCDVNESFEAGAGGWTNSPDSTCTTGTFAAATPT